MPTSIACSTTPGSIRAPTVGVRLVSVVNDNMQHVGQIIYQKACLRSGGWFPNPPA